jgi:hypothetical protein
MPRPSVSRSNAEKAAEAAAVAAVRAVRDDTILEDEALDLANNEAREAVRKLSPGGELRFRVDRVKPLNKQGFLDEISIDQVDPVYFRDTWGAGEYRVYARYADGTYVRGTHMKLKVSGAEDAPRAANGHGESASDLLRTFQAEQERRDRERAESRKELLVALGAPLIGLAGTIGSAIISRKPDVDIAALVTALRSDNRGGSLSEITSALKNLDDMRRGGDTSNAVLEGALKLLERFKDLPPSSDKGDDGWLGTVRDLLRELAPLAKGALEARAQAQGARPPPGATTVRQPPPVGAPATPAIPAGAVAPVVLVPPPAAAEPSGTRVSSDGPNGVPSASAMSAGPSAPIATEDVSLTPEQILYRAAEPWLRKQAENLLGWAENEADEATVADALVMSIPRLFREHVPLEQLEGWLKRQDWWEQLVQFHPPLSAFKAWCEAVHAELVAWVEDEIASEANARGNGASEASEHGGQ